MAGKKKGGRLLKVGLLAGLLTGVACIFRALSGKKKVTKVAKKKSSKKKKA
jgi:hypothetical protein